MGKATKKEVEFRNTTHVFRKTTLHGKRDHSDDYRCELCGIKANRPAFADYVTIRTSSGTPHLCKKHVAVTTGTIIQITACGMFSTEAEPLTPGSVHATLAPPPGEANTPGVWVMGKTEPVRLLVGEYFVCSEEKNYE